MKKKPKKLDIDVAPVPLETFDRSLICPKCGGQSLTAVYLDVAIDGSGYTFEDVIQVECCFCGFKKLVNPIDKEKTK